MRVLMDHCVDTRVRDLLVGHDVTDAMSMGWAELSNGQLLTRAEADGFDAVVTTDKSYRFQQNLAGRRISLITLNPRFTVLEQIVPLAPKLLLWLNNGFPPGSDIVIEP